MKTFTCDGCGAKLPEARDGHPRLRADTADFSADVRLECVCWRSGKTLDLCIFCTTKLIGQMAANGQPMSVGQTAAGIGARQ